MDNIFSNYAYVVSTQGLHSKEATKFRNQYANDLEFLKFASAYHEVQEQLNISADIVYVLHNDQGHVHTASSFPSTIRQILQDDCESKHLDQLRVTEYRDGQPRNLWNCSELPDFLRGFSTESSDTA